MFERNLRRHQSEFCLMRIQLCQECGRDTIGEVCGRCDEGGAHVDEQLDRQTFVDIDNEELRTVDAETLRVIGDEAGDFDPEEYYGL